jgi:HEAT repeat protein
MYQRNSWGLAGGLICVLVTCGCGKGATSRLPELRQPPKPTGQQIAELRRQMLENEPPLAPMQSAPRPMPSTELPAFKEWGVRETAADALARIGPPALPALIDALRDRNPDVRNRAAQALARMGPPAKPAVPELIVALHDSDWQVRRSAARALGQIGVAAEEAVPALIEVIRNPASDQRDEADGAARS